MIKKILGGGKSLIAGVIALVVLTAFRIPVLLNGIDYTDGLNGLYSAEGNIYNVIFYVLLCVMAVLITFAAVVDIRNPEKNYETKIGGHGLTAIGAVLIATGALQAVQVVNEFTTGINVFTFFLIMGCVAHVVGGVVIASAKAVHPAHSVVAIAVVLSQIVQMIEFYIDNFLIDKTPQKLMMMLFLLSSTFFWIYFGRIQAGDKKFLPKLFCVAGGFASTALSLSFLISSFILLGIDGEKWVMLSYVPGLSLIPAMLIPGVTATVVLLSGAKGTEQVQTENKAEADSSEKE